MAERTTGAATSELTGTRGRVLTSLRAAGGPASVDDLAEELGVHRNTVRFHLEALVSTGLVEEGRQASGGKGRPKAVYQPTDHGARTGRRNYQLMASALTDYLARTSAEPQRDALEAGRGWGRRIAQTAKGRQRRRTSLSATVEMFDAMGFEPQLDGQRRPTQIRLHNCPFREVVDEHQDLVCAIHAGLLEGMVGGVPESTPTVAAPLAGPGAVPAARLEPFATPQTCIVHLRAASA
ncbi:MAG: helix-turn-helix domain-containing protein [Actinobacteria bacterium]|nr:helix-turn-helix domain-containing protein [Actinomycetota bacterium]